MLNKRARFGQRNKALNNDPFTCLPMFLIYVVCAYSAPQTKCFATKGAFIKTGLCRLCCGVAPGGWLPFFGGCVPMVRSDIACETSC